MTLPKFKVKPRKPGKTKNHKLYMRGESITKQSEKDSCDINLIMAHYVKTRVLLHQRDNEPEYGFASSDTFNESMQIVAKAQSMFAELPSGIRSKFENNPAKFLDFVQDERNLEEMQEMGLANKRSNEKAEIPIPAKQSEAKETKIAENLKPSESEAKE